MAAAPEPRVFRFEIQRRYLPLLAGLGVTPKTASATIGPEELDVRFGFLRCRTPVSNITCAMVTGPYKAYRAIGARASFADSGATFGTTTAGGVCLEFRDPVQALDPTGILKHEALTVTVVNREEFVAVVREMAGF